jgi:hypothetical protein
VVSAPNDGEAPEVERARTRSSRAATVAALADVPIPVEDIALAVRLSIRTQPGVDDSVYFKERALAVAAPELVLPTLADPCPDPTEFCIQLVPTRALEIRGRVRLPEYRNPDSQVFERDANGIPVQTGTNEVPFMMTLPLEALDGPVPIVMYQHGNPGGPIEATRDGGTGYLDDAGFAVAGIQDTLNRQIGRDVALQLTVILFSLVQWQQVPDYWSQTGADMIGFLRAIEAMGSLDLLHRDALGHPAIGPDGVPEIDTSRILFHGISENRAALALRARDRGDTDGRQRTSRRVMIHQSSDAPRAVPPYHAGCAGGSLGGAHLFQLGFDPQDGHLPAPFYRELLYVHRFQRRDAALGTLHRRCRRLAGAEQRKPCDGSRARHPTRAAGRAQRADTRAGGRAGRGESRPRAHQRVLPIRPRDHAVLRHAPAARGTLLPAKRPRGASSTPTLPRVRARGRGRDRRAVRYERVPCRAFPLGAGASSGARPRASRRSPARRSRAGRSPIR